MSILKALHKEASRCVKCGTCLSSCPVYAETLSETNSARGKMSLIESLATGDIQLTKKVNHLMSYCLMCGACTEGCPNQVNVSELILEMRRVLTARHGLPVFKRALFYHLLLSPQLLRHYLKAGSLLQGLLLKKIPNESGLHLRFSLPYLSKKRMIPPLAKTFFIPTSSPLMKSPREKMTVGYFAGCITNYLFPHVGNATLRILTTHGCSLIIPPDQKCCGLVAMGSGDWPLARKLALANIEAFEKVNAVRIVATCASCSATLKTFYPLLFKDADLPTQEKVARFSKQVMDISEFLTKELNIQFPRKPPTLIDGFPKITYHDPCHLHHTLGITHEPRAILKSLPELTFVEMKESSRCCGMGGLFTLTHSDLSSRIRDHKLDILEKMGVDIVATSCSGCLLHLMDGIHQRGMHIRIVHLMEILEEGLR